MEYTLISAKEFNEARKKIRESKGKEIVFYSSDDDLLRKVLEKEKINMILISLKDRKDKVKQRDSGFNQVLAKIAKAKDIKVGINLDEVFDAGKEERTEILSRIRQNIKICRKDKVKMEFVSKRAVDKYNLNALGIVLGMPTWMAKRQ